MKTIYVNNENIKALAGCCHKDNAALNEINEIVVSIIKEVKDRGEEALVHFTKEFDGIELNDIRVSESEIEDAFSIVEDDFKNILEEAMKNIKTFHENQVQKSWMDCNKKNIVLGQLITPIERVGIYVPGGTAAYPSTVLMNAIPAKIAGVSSIAMVTPPGEDGKVNPTILAAAKIAGVDEIYKVGGAQAIAALAYGTENIAPVQKIVGPGNIYVAVAKKMVYGQVDIDMMAGPSEICIVADHKAVPKFIAADLLSQAEHDEMASTILITTSEEVAKAVLQEISIQVGYLSRRDIIQKAIDSFGVIFIVKNIGIGIELANEIAPEHLELMVENPFEWLSGIKNAGAVFMGSYSPEPLGDYFAGPNHTLPTNGTAKYSSPLGVEDFIKKSSIIYYNEKALCSVKDSIIKFAEREGLSAHANSIKVRFTENG